MKFKGYHFAELAEHWGEKYNIPELKSDDVDEIAKTIRNFLIKLDSKFEADVAKDIREFLAALEEQSFKIDYWWPVWRGLREIENDFTLLQATIALIDHMWT